MSTMKAVTYASGRLGAELVEKPVPRVVEPDQIQVRIKATGICGSDVHILRGEIRVKDGVTLGHETSGVVTEVGAGVTRVKVGDRIAVEGAAGCGECNLCRKGKISLCPSGGLGRYIGLAVDGGLAEYLVVREGLAHTLADHVSHEQATLCEPVSTILRAVQHMQPLDKNDRILVLGGGIIGLLASTYLEDLGFSHVTLCQRSEPRRRIVSRQCPTVQVIGPEHLDEDRARPPEQRVHTFDYILETTGNPTALQQSVQHLNPGGNIVLYGCCPRGSKIEVDPQTMLLKELSMVASMGPGRGDFAAAVGLVADLARRCKLDLTILGVQMFPKAEWERAVARLETREIAKAVIIVDSSDS